MSTTTHLRTAASQHGDLVTEELLDGSEAIDGGKWALYCWHGDEVGVVQDTNRRRLWEWARHSTGWCCHCQDAQNN